VTESSRPLLRQPWALVAAALVLAAYAAVLSAMPKGAFWSPDEGAKFIQLHSLEWRHGLRYAIPYGAQHIDPEFEFYPTRCRFEDIYPVPRAGGGVTFHWPMWFPLGSRLLVDAFGLTGLYVVPLLSGWLIALLAGRLIGAWDTLLAPLAILAVGLATPIAFFSLTFWEHTLATLLGLAALTLVAGGRPRRIATLWLIAPLLLAAALLRIEMLLFGIAVLCAWFAAGRWEGHGARAAERAHPTTTRSRRGASIALAVVLVAVLVLLFAEVVPDRHRWILTMLPHYLSGSVAKLPYLGEALTGVLVDMPGNQSPAIPNLWRYAALAACLVAAWAPRARTPRAEAIALLVALAVVLELSMYLVVRPQPYLTLHGFLPVAPLIVLAPYALSSAWRQRRYPQLVIAVAATAYALLAFAAIFVFQVSAEGAPPTGLQWGNRYLLTLYPIGTVLALAALVDYQRSARPAWLKRSVIAAAVGLLLCGVLLEVRGVWMLRESRRLAATWQEALRGGPPVMTDVWWLPAAMAPLFISHEVQCVRHVGDLNGWVPLAAQHGVDTVVFAGFHTLDADAVRPPGFAVTAEGEQIVSGLHLTRLRFTPVGGPVDAGAATR
jgi:hypothetical protein